MPRWHRRQKERRHRTPATIDRHLADVIFRAPPDRFATGCSASPPDAGWALPSSPRSGSRPATRTWSSNHASDIDTYRGRAWRRRPCTAAVAREAEVQPQLDHEVRPRPGSDPRHCGPAPLLQEYGTRVRSLVLSSNRRPRCGAIRCGCRKQALEVESGPGHYGAGRRLSKASAMAARTSGRASFASGRCTATYRSSHALTWIAILSTTKRIDECSGCCKNYLKRPGRVAVTDSLDDTVREIIMTAIIEWARPPARAT
jgi:hypothetical protein